MLLRVAIVLLIGIVFSYEVGAASIDSPLPGTVLYYTVGQPATINVAVLLDASGGQSLNQVSSFRLGSSRSPSSFLQFGPVSELLPGVQKNLSSTWAASATLTASSSQGVLQGTYSLPVIQDGNYTISVFFFSANELTTSFQVVTTRQPDAIIITNSSQAVVRTVEILDGSNATLGCTVVNSKPGYNLQWDTQFGTSTAPSVATDGYGVANSSISLIVTASVDAHNAQITCNGDPASSIPGLERVTATATIYVIYGPNNSSTSVTLVSPSGSVTCPLRSYPPITSYLWTQDGLPTSCTSQNCPITSSGTRSQLTCQGSNLRTSTVAMATISVLWTVPPIAPTTATATGLSSDPGAQSSGLSGGEIAAIVIGAVVFLVLVIVIPVVCVRRKRSKGNGQRSSNGRPVVSTPPAQQTSRPYSFDNASAVHGGGYKSPVSGQPDLVRNSGFSPSALEAGQQKAPATPPPAYPGAIDMIDQKPRSRKPIAIYDTALDDAYPNQTNASYMPSPKY